METTEQKQHDLEMKILKSDLEEKEFNFQRSKKDAEYFEQHQRFDLLSSREEIKRRGIEVCLNVLKMNSTLKASTVVLAEDKLQKFIKELEIN